MLGSLREAYSHAHITWICGRGGFELIRLNPLIDRPLPLTLESIVLLDAEHYDLCINFDLAPEAASLAARIKADHYQGFGRKTDGSNFSFTPEGNEWLEMSLWDDKKKANRRTYQSHMRRILCVPDHNHPILLPLLPHSTNQAQEFARHHGLQDKHPLIGFNVGAGERWQHKKWTVEGFVDLARQIYETYQSPALILYGPDDARRAEEVMKALASPYVDTGVHPSVLDFAAILDLCDVVVTGDTLALHASLALGKRVICLVGPTSAQELELYGQGVILQGDIDCLGCYLTRCDKDPHCMKLLDSETVFRAVQQQIEQLP